MKPTETTQFEHLCETMRNMHYYKEALESLTNSAKRLSEQGAALNFFCSDNSLRVSTQSFIIALSVLELNIELFKRKYIQDIIGEYNETQQHYIDCGCKKYHIPEE